jgi:hypothetical protein
MICGGPASYESRRQQKLTSREVNSMDSTTPSFPRWSESAITFDKTDQTECRGYVPRVHDQDESTEPCGGRHRPTL